MNPQEKISEVSSATIIKSDEVMDIQENNVSSIANEQQSDKFSSGMIVPQKKLDENEEKQIWKLFKGKTVLVFRFCGSCQYKLFHSTDKWAKNKDGIDVKFHLCPRCVRVNCMLTNLMAPAMPKKFVQKLENENGKE